MHLKHDLSRKLATTYLMAMLLGCTGAGDAEGSNATADVGSCDEELARTLLVRSNNKVEYAGQAILNVSCAVGECHASSAIGDNRHGAPEGVDFDLEPATVVDASDQAAVVSGGIPLDSNELDRLQRNQERVYELRERIWGRLQNDTMPPKDATGAQHRGFMAGAPPRQSGASCGQGEDSAMPITDPDTQEILRNWLACGSPVVEVSDRAISAQTLATEPAGRRGTVGQQMPLCDE